MTRTITTSLSILSTIALLGLANASAAEEMYVIRDGELIKEALQWPDDDPVKNPWWSGWVNCAGETVDGLFVVPQTVGDKQNHSRFVAAKSALGDCEFRAVFSYQGSKKPSTFPNVAITSRGCLRFSSDGGQARMDSLKAPLPLEAFSAPCTAGVYDGKLHSMVVKRVDDKLSFYCDDKKLNEQSIDPDANLHIWFDSLSAATKIKTIKLTAEKMSDKLEPAFKSAAPIEVIFKGSRVIQETLSKDAVKRIEGRDYAPGKAAVYRIPALVVTTKGTILAFAEARASGYDWGHIRIVVRRSEDDGKTWGPEIDTTNGKFPDSKVGNPVPVVDRDTGRIFLIGSFNTNPIHTNPGPGKVMIVHSDDDGKSWSEARMIPMAEWFPKGFTWLLTGPGHGIQLTRGKHKGRLIAPCYGEGCGFVVYSDDHGETWTVGANSPSGPYNEATCVELSNGDIMLNTRSPGGRGARTPNRGSAVLTDGGATYKEGTSRFIPELPCPSCQAGTVRYSWPQGDKPGVILFAGPGSTSGRVRATLWASHDDGKTWPYSQKIYEGGSGYSDINVLPNGKIIYLFEKDGKHDLGFTVLPAPPAAPEQ